MAGKAHPTRNSGQLRPPDRDVHSYDRKLIAHRFEQHPGAEALPADVMLVETVQASGLSNAILLPTPDSGPVFQNRIEPCRLFRRDGHLRELPRPRRRVSLVPFEGGDVDADVCRGAGEGVVLQPGGTDQLGLVRSDGTLGYRAHEGEVRVAPGAFAGVKVVSTFGAHYLLRCQDRSRSSETSTGDVC